MVEHQLGAGVPQPTTAGSLWQAMSGRPLSADLLDWPPDPFALTSLVLQRSGAFRFALSPPSVRQWPPGSRSAWSTTVEAAGRAWSGVVDAPREGSDRSHWRRDRATTLLLDVVSKHYVSAGYCTVMARRRISAAVPQVSPHSSGDRAKVS